MIRLRVAVAAALLGGCGSIPTTPDGVAFLEVAPPADLTIGIGETAQFHATGLDKSGNPLPGIAITWRTPDTTITVNETTGLVTGVSAGPGRVQAVLGTVDPKKPDSYFISDFVTVTVTSPPAGAAGR